MSQAGDVVAAIVIIAILTRFDLIFVGFYYILKRLGLTD